MHKREYIFVTKHNIKINTHEPTAIIKKQAITNKNLVTLKVLPCLRWTTISFHAFWTKNLKDPGVRGGFNNKLPCAF